MKKWLKRIGLTLLGLVLLVGALAAYAYFIEPRGFVVVEETIAIPNWDAKLSGFKVVLISDIHAGSNYAPLERLRYVVERANEQNADLILLLGDYVSEAKRGRDRNAEAGTDGTELRIPVETIADNLQGLKARYGVYAVIGNHDWYHNAQKVQRELERVGINVLENEIEEIQVGEQKVRLWAIEDFWKNRRVPTSPFDNLPDKSNVIAITHNPDSLLLTPSGIAVMFAGHSHGGQVNFPFFGTPAPVNDRRFMRGHVEVDGKHVYVTVGVGTSVVPLRLRALPEIAVVTLHAAK
jgi:predicted MPP superfamily phosphohydrolase